MKFPTLFSGYGIPPLESPIPPPHTHTNSDIPQSKTWIVRDGGNGRYSTFYVLYPIGVGAEFWTTMSAVKEAYAWSPLYAMFMVAVFVGYIPGKNNPYKRRGIDGRVVYTLYAYDEAETESLGNYEKREDGC